MPQSSLQLDHETKRQIAELAGWWGFSTTRNATAVIRKLVIEAHARERARRKLVEKVKSKQEIKMTAAREILQQAQERGTKDGEDGYPGPDAADVADLVTEATTDEMTPAEYNQIAKEISAAYAEGYGKGRRKAS